MLLKAESGKSQHLCFCNFKHYLLRIEISQRKMIFTAITYFYAESDFVKVTHTSVGHWRKCSTYSKRYLIFERHKVCFNLVSPNL